MSSLPLIGHQAKPLNVSISSGPWLQSQDPFGAHSPPYSDQISYEAEKRAKEIKDLHA